MTLLFYSTVDSAARWRAQLERLSRELDIRVWPEIGDPAEIDYALVWRPAPGLLATLPNLKLILSLGAGVDHLLGDPRLPRHLPIVRYWHPDEFKALERAGYELGFDHIAAGPLVRSSYHADQHVPQERPGVGPLALAGD